MRTHVAAIALLGALAQSAIAQAPSHGSPIGTWRGTSTCLVRPSSCNDEVVVYRITPLKAADSLSVAAFKIVHGEEQDMGTLGCVLTNADGQIRCAIPRGVWQFSIHGDSLTGELKLPNETKFRDVRATRAR